MLSPGASVLTSATVDSQRSAGAQAVGRRVGAERRDAVHRDPAADRVEVRRGLTERGGAVRDVSVEMRVRLRRGEEALELQLGEPRVRIRRREVAHQADDARAWRGELGEAPAAHARVELEMHGDVGRHNLAREAQLEPRLARGGDCGRPGRAEQDDPRRRQGAPQLQGLPERCHAERGCAGPERRPPHVHRAVPVAVGLDDGPELGGLEQPAQHTNVVADRGEVDRDQRTGHCHHCGDSSHVDRAAVPGEADIRALGLKAAFHLKQLVVGDAVHLLDVAEHHPARVETRRRCRASPRRSPRTAAPDAPRGSAARR